ncbi:Thiamin biosynthesis lipoprotein ApbE [hydrothermal vent metagenome]|uniref:FAD:protein FMN transferase n=1 Tax=hydrothermal vent metagenome TaxID=652676 RepID=A0A1W1EC25_9ZZZZ
MKSLLLITLLFSSLFANQNIKEEELLSRTRALMGTYVSITLAEKHNSTISSSFNLIQNIEDSLSTYDPNATLAKLNKNHVVPYDLYLPEAIKLSKNYYIDTKGYFDITIGSISKKLYHFGEEKTYSPSKEALHQAVLNIDGIHLNEHNITTEKHIVVDLGGMGKGYAVDKTVAYLKEQNISKGIIALSGDIQCLHKCEIYLQSPFSEATFAKVNTLHPYTSISTSGTYRRYATKKSEHHLINPKTATQGRAFVSVSLFTLADNSKIDAYATAVSVMPKDKALTFLKEHTEIGYVLVEPDGNIITGNLENLLEIKL